MDLKISPLQGANAAGKGASNAGREGGEEREGRE